MNAFMEREHSVVQSVDLGGSSEDVWGVVGGFFNIHTWHPDITHTAVPADQTLVSSLRRELTFPGQPITVEELVVMDNDSMFYKYKWVKGEWGEKVKEYRAELRVISTNDEGRCIVRWSSTFVYVEDAVSGFYLNGFRELQRRFPLP